MATPAQMAEMAEMMAHLPPGYMVEYTGGQLMATCITFAVLESIFMVLLYVSRFWLNDQKANWSMVALMTGTYFVCLSKITIGILATQIGGAGRHTLALSMHTLTNALKLSTALQIICPTSTNLAKLSILCLFYNIFGRTSARYRMVIRITFALVVMSMIVQIIIPFANCKPFNMSWTLGGQDHCAIDGLILWKYLSIPSLITTLVMVAIPIPALYNLKVAPATKIGLAFVLTVCVAGVITAIMRFASFLQVQSFNDFTFEQIRPLCWTVAESGIYMIAGVLPTLRPLMRKIFGNVAFERIISSFFESKKSSTGGSWKLKGLSDQGSSAKPMEHEKNSYSVLSEEKTSAGSVYGERGMV